MKTAIFLYETSQLASLDALIAKWSGGGETPIIVSLDAEIDFALEKRGGPFISGKALQNRTAPAACMRADELTYALCDSATLSFLRYREVSLLEPLCLLVHIYFSHLFYYVDVIERFMEHTPETECLVVPISAMSISKTSGPLAAEEVKIVLEATRLVAEKRGIRYESYNVLSTALQAKNYWQEWAFTLKRALFGATLLFLNACIALHPRRPLRILASDYWHSLAPILQLLPEAELILLDRKEALRAGFRNIWRHKMRFVHIEQFLSQYGRRQALAHAKKCTEEWMVIRKEMLMSVDFTFRGVSLEGTAERILTHLIKTAVPDIIRDIEGAYAMYERLSPDVVLLRASVSGQRHFAILPLVAREVGISALEVQHGGEYLGPGSGTRRHAARFLATYGPLVCSEFRALGYEEERLFAVGSPRFDAYIKDAKKSVAMEKKSDLTILSNTPTMDINERYGTYSIEEYFKTLGGAVCEIPNARLLVASRSTTVRSAFLEEARSRGLSGVNYESVGTTPLPELFRQADIFVCSYSTVVYEALTYRLPVVIAAFAPVEKMMADFHFSHFKKAGALRIAHSPEELSEMLQELSIDPEARARMSEAGWAFMRKNFSFDGHASERIAGLVRGWSNRATA
ncbi:MAG TPA: glycosyltransferase [Candidatus Paceibacterota bacterium]